MEKTILIAGTSEELQTELAQESLSQRYKTAVALSPEAAHPPIGEDWEKLLRYFEWNKRSALSAKNLVLETLAFGEPLDEAFLVFQPPSDGRAVHELPLAEIERRVDETIKGFLFLVKEIVLSFQKKKKGTLTLVLHEPLNVVSPLSLGASSFYRGLGSALFTQYQNEPFACRGFHSTTQDVKDFARFLIVPKEKPEKTFGKWNKYSGKSGFWSFGRS